MARKAKHTEEQRIRAVEEYLKGEGSHESIEKKYGIGKTTFRNYVRRAWAEWIDGLHISSKNSKIGSRRSLRSFQCLL